MRLRLAAAAAALACLAPTLAACGGGGDTANVGDVVPAHAADQFSDAQQSSIALPIGQLQIHAGDPVVQVHADDTRELTAQTAPAGMAYLPIGWDFGARTPAAYSPYIGTTDLPTVDLRIGGDHFRLPTPDPSQSPESFYVLVPKREGHPRAAVHFDGVTQSVDLATGKVRAGRAEGLYDLSYKRPQPAKCGVTPQWEKVVIAKSTCEVTAPILLPYAGGKWAKPGHSWLVVSVRTTLSSMTQAGDRVISGGTYYPVGLTTDYRLGRRRPSEVLRAKSFWAVCPVPRTGGCNSSASIIFDKVGPAHVLTVRQTYRLQLGTGWGGFDGPHAQSQDAVTTIGLRKAS